MRAHTCNTHTLNGMRGCENANEGGKFSDDFYHVESVTGLAIMQAPAQCRRAHQNERRKIVQ